MKAAKKTMSVLFLILSLGLLLLRPVPSTAQEKVGVLFVVHGGFSTYQAQYLWDASVQMFSYEPNHPVYKVVIWNPESWNAVLQLGNAPKELPKYAFEYARLGGVDPFQSITNKQLADMKSILDSNSNACGKIFEVDWVSWMSGDDVSHYPYPRFMYYGPDGPAVGFNCTYCGENEPGGSWTGCESNRYNVDGPAERLFKKGVSRIIMVDLTVGGVRFSKSFDVFKMTKRALAENGGGAIPVTWINDINDLMTRSYPINPTNWTPQMSYNRKTGPTTDTSVPLAGNPNPIASDPELAELNVTGIEASMSSSVTDAETGVLLLNHALVDWAEYFDPKIDDTLVINNNIKSQLLARHPTMDLNNIIGAYMGITEADPECGNEVARTRTMRGENLGNAWLYETTQCTPCTPVPPATTCTPVCTKQLPASPWGYRYWDALEYLKNRGVKHILIGFPQIISDSVLNLVEIPNQIGKEIGIKTWAKWGTKDYATYPVVGHPFADYWGMWVNTDCGGVPCCFVMGGCGDPARPYPPPIITCPRDDLNQSLAFDLSDYGHLGYDPLIGPPDSNGPVQNQYRGTWAMYKPASGNSCVGHLLAKHVLNAVSCSYTQPCNPVTVIDLAEFKAEPGNRKVIIVWTTGAEIDNAGFNIYRSTEENGTYAKINDELIPAKGSPSDSATYQFIDKPVKNRTTYWYKLEDIDLKGEATMHGPVSARPNLLKFFKK